MWPLVKTVWIFAVSVLVSPSLSRYVNFIPISSFNIPLYAKHSWKDRNEEWRLWRGRQSTEKCFFLMIEPKQAVFSTFIKYFLNCIHLFIGNINSYANLSNCMIKFVFYHGVLVQWNCSVGGTGLCGVAVLEKNLCVLQRPMATETWVFHRGPFLSAVKLVNARNHKTVRI